MRSSIFNHSDADEGFCDYDLQSTLYGRYAWEESEKGVVRSLRCQFDSDCKDKADGNATRMCVSHDQWGEYKIDEESCITEVTFELRCIIAKVTLLFIHYSLVT